jgi:hypothetical protein
VACLTRKAVCRHPLYPVRYTRFMCSVSYIGGCTVRRVIANFTPELQRQSRGQRPISQGLGQAAGSGCRAAATGRASCCSSASPSRTTTSRCPSSRPARWDCSRGLRYTQKYGIATHTIITVCFLAAQPVEQFGVVPLRSEYQSVPNIWQNTAHYSKMYPTYHHSLAYRSDTEDVFGIRRVLQYQWPVS